MIRQTLDAGVWRVTLDRPEKRNALTPDSLAELRAAVTSAPEGARCLLLEGEGPAFCAGFDLDACRDDPAGSLGRLLDDLSHAVRAMRDLPIPVVINAHGAAVAGGCALLGGADVVVADRNAKLGYPVVRLGISPAVSAPFLLRGVSAGRTRALMLDPGLISGERAHAIGLVDEVTGTAEQAGARSGEVAAALAGKPAHALAATRAWVRTIEAITEDEADAGLRTSADLLEGDELTHRLDRFWGMKS